MAQLPESQSGSGSGIGIGLGVTFSIVAKPPCMEIILVNSYPSHPAGNSRDIMMQNKKIIINHSSCLILRNSVFILQERFCPITRDRF